MNLSGSMVASSFGKLVMKESPREGVKEEDLAIALLMMITNNIGTHTHGHTDICIFFAFIMHHSLSTAALTFISSIPQHLPYLCLSSTLTFFLPHTLLHSTGQVSYLNAQLHGCTKIFFVGSFLRHNPISCRRLAFAINFWSKGKMEALFLAHEVRTKAERVCMWMLEYDYFDLY